MVQRFIKSSVKLRPNNPAVHSKLEKKSSLSRSVKFGIIAGISFLMMAALGLWSIWQEPLTGPTSNLTRFHFLKEFTKPSEPKIVYGFLPYWNMAQFETRPELTHLAYFGLAIGADGELETTVDGNIAPGYNQLQSETFLEAAQAMKDQGGQMELVLTLFNPEFASKFLRSEVAQNNLLENLDSILLAYPISGINLDVEVNNEGKALQTEMVAFVKKVREHLNGRYDHVGLSLDVYPSAARNENIWQVAELEPYLDFFVVMAYDFHRRGSPQAGPVAPLFGGDEYWSSDISTHLKEFTDQVPTYKILLGMPFYGYEWQTTTRDSQSNTYPDTGATATYKRIQTILQQKDELDVQEHWNEEALSPYLSYVEDDKIYVIYYDNARSISYKLDFVNQLDLAGVAIWALGYEGDTNELWQVIENKLR